MTPEESTSETDPCPPVGTGNFIVQKGDCMSSIASEKGFFWDDLWNLPANAELKAVRRNPNVLLEGDRVEIPEKKQKHELGQTEKRHSFVRRGQPCFLRLRILANGRPRAGEDFELLVDSAKRVKGKIDANGFVATSCNQPQSVPISPSARRATLRVGPPENQTIYEIKLGHLNPGEHPDGIQQRQNNLCDDTNDNLIQKHGC